MRSTIAFIIVCCLSFHDSFANSDATVQSKNFNKLVGCWKGSITYLDYRSNKPFSMPAEMIVKDFKNSNHIIYSLIYPEETNTNTVDTLVISKNGRYINKEKVISNKKLNQDSLEIVTEIDGMDGNDNKAALIRHTYIISNNTYSIKKEVKFSGQASWILINEYRFTRTTPCG